jgi:hypothetical protein
VSALRGKRGKGLDSETFRAYGAYRAGPNASRFIIEKLRGEKRDAI